MFIAPSDIYNFILPMNKYDTNPIYKQESDFDDALYLASIEQYKGQSWYDRLLENPWLGSKQLAFKPNFWQQIGESVGDVSARQSYYQDIASKRNQWLSDTLAQYHQQDYDSANSQVERERAAGLNPDLNGNITAGSAAENDQPLQPSGMPQDSVFPDVLNVGVSMVSTAVNLASAFQGIASTHLDNALKSMKLKEGFKESAWKTIGESLTETLTGLEDYSSVDNDDDGSLIVSKLGDSMPEVFQIISDRIDSMPYSASEKRKLKRIFPRMIRDKNGAPTMDYKKLVSDKLASLKESRTRNFKASGMPGADETDPAAANFMAKNVFLRINPLLLKVQELELQIKEQYSEKAIEEGVAANQAISENEGYKLKSAVNEVRNQIASTFKDIGDALMKDPDIPTFWKMAIQGALSSGQLMLYSKLGGF